MDGAGLGISLIIKGVQLALDIYDKGFSKVNAAERLYIEFGVAIQGLAQNLQTIRDVIQNANDKRKRLSGPLDLGPLTQILGDYNKTLLECKKLLRDKSEFGRDRNGFVLNIIWNNRIQPQVARLRDRVAFHNLKILTVLQPLELKLLADIRDLVESSHVDVMEYLEEIRGLIINGPDRVADEKEAPRTGLLQVPIELAARFDEASIAARPELHDISKFPLDGGMDAFILHFKEGISLLETASYLGLMKSVWIIQRVKEGTEYKSSPLGSLWNRYVKGMDKKLSQECQRLTAARVPLPEVTTLVQLPEEEFRIWPLDDQEPDTELLGDGSYMEELLNKSLPSQDSRIRVWLRVFRNLNGTLHIQNSVMTNIENQMKDKVRLFDVNLAQAHLVPLYASPDSSGDAYNLRIKSDRTSANGLVPCFGGLRDLLEFQELITGYETATYRKAIKTICCTSPSYSLRETLDKERGSLQIWVRKRPRKANGDGTESDTSSSHISMSLSPGVNVRTPDPVIRRYSVASGKAFDKISRKDSIASSMLSYGGRSTAAISLPNTFISTTHTAQVAIGSDTHGIVMEKPELPLLVLFLERMTDKRLSFLALQMDQQTRISIESCNCRRDPTCRVAVIERTKGTLNARRFVAEDGLDGWNLAAIGTTQFSSRPDVVPAKDLRHVSIEFPSIEDRVKFVTKFDEITNLYLFRSKELKEDITRIGAQHIYSY